MPTVRLSPPPLPSSRHDAARDDYEGMDDNDDDDDNPTRAPLNTAKASAPAFVKRRTKPRQPNASSSTSRISASTSTSQPPSQSSTPHQTTANQRTAPRSALDDDDEDDDEEGNAAPSVVVRSRPGRGRRTASAVTATAATSARSIPARPPRSTNLSFATDGDSDDDDGNGDRTEGSPATPAKGGIGRDPEVRAPSQRTRIGRPPAPPDNLDQASIEAPHVASASRPTSLYTPAALAALKASTPSLTHRRDAAALPPGDGDGDGDTSGLYRRMVDPATQTDPTTGDALTRLKFGADFAHDGIPTEAVIAAAKEKRRRAAEASVGGAAAAGAHEGDFISLGGGGGASTAAVGARGALQRYGVDGTDDVGHAGVADLDRRSRAARSGLESTLRREEDEYGDGEEADADFTEATQRIALDELGRARAERELRRERRELVEAGGGGGEGGKGAGAGPGAGGASGSGTDSEAEWERAQLERTRDAASEAKRRAHREASPYRPAPIPLTAPLPTATSCAARLAAKLDDAEQQADSHRRVRDDAARALRELEDEERENRAAVERASEKEAWFREMEEFFLRVTAFLAEKTPVLDGIERDMLGILAERTRIVQRRRAAELVDDLSMFAGVPTVSLLPPPAAAPTAQEAPDDAARAEEEEEPSPLVEGDYNGEARQRRRRERAERAAAAASRASVAAAAEARVAAGDEYELSVEDAAALEVAKGAIARRYENMLDDVKAPEFLSPAPRLPATSSSSVAAAADVDEARRRRRLHPASMAARFSQWRRRYPEEYAGAWGGLLLAKGWQFWARLEMCQWWDVLGAPRRRRDKGGGHGDGEGDGEDDRDGGVVASLDGFAWHVELLRYVEAFDDDGADDGGDVAMRGGDGQGGSLGGDDEAMRQLTSDVVVSRLVELAERGAFDVWEPLHSASAAALAEQCSYVLERHELRFRSLVAAYVGAFARQVRRLREGLATLSSSSYASSSRPSALPPPRFHPESIPARMRVLAQLATLLRNLVRWARQVPASSSAAATAASHGVGRGSGGVGEPVGERAELRGVVDVLVGEVMWPMLQDAKEHGGAQLAKEVLRSTPQDLFTADVASRLGALASHAP